MSLTLIPIMHLRNIKNPKNYLAALFLALILLSLVTLIAWLTPNAHSASITDDGAPGQWTLSNPGGGGAFAAIGAGPTGIVLAASDLTGAYRSRDHGKTWDNIGAFDGLVSTHASSVGFDPQDGNILYIGTEEGIFRSQNGGDTVQRVLQGGYISEIKFAHSNPQIGYAGYQPEWNSNQASVYKSSDRGLSWRKISQTLPGGLRILKLIVHPSDPNTLYLLSGKARFASGTKTVYRSSDGGVNWSQIGANLGAVMDIALDPNAPTVLYLSSYLPVMDGEYETYNSGSFHRSSDGGNTWTKMSDRTGAIWIDRDDQHAIRLIHVNHQWPWDAESNGVWESTNNGASWTKVSAVDDWGMGWVQAYWVYHESFDGPVKSLGEDLSNPDTLWWTNTQWVLATFNDGRRFAHQYTDEVSKDRWRSRGFDNVVALDMAISPVDGHLYVGYYDIGCWHSDDSLASWQICNHPDYGWSEGKGGNMLTVEADPTRAGVVWSSQSRNIGEKATVLRSTDAGKSWTPATSGLAGTLIAGLSVDATSPANNRTLFVTAEGNVYSSSDDGNTWAKRFDCNGCRQTAVDRFNGKLVYAGGETGLWRSTTGGTAGSWKKIGLAEMAGGLGDSFYTSDWEGVVAIVPDPVNTNWVYVTAFGSGRGLYRSKDAGVTWQKLWTNDYARNIAIPPANPQTLFVTSSSSVNRGLYNPGALGVLVSNDGGGSWRQVNDGLEWPFAGNIAIDPRNPSRVYLDSPGTGIHQRDFGNTPPATATATPTAAAGGNNLIKNGDFSQGETFWSVGGTGLHHNAEGGELCLFYDQAIANLWEASIAQDGVALLQGKKYRLKLRLWSQTSATIKLIVGENQPPWTNYWNQLVPLPADQVDFYTYEFSMSQASDANAGLYFHVGGHASQVLCVDQVELTIVEAGTAPTPTPSPTRTSVSTPTGTTRPPTPSHPPTPNTTATPKPTPTFATGRGGLSGKVVNESVNPLAGIRVSAWRYQEGRWREVGKTKTDASGDYRLDNLLAVNHRLRFYDPNRLFKTEYYDNISRLGRSVDLPIVSGAMISELDATLADAKTRVAEISGAASYAVDPTTGEVQINAWAGSEFTLSYPVSCGDTGAVIDEATLLIGEQAFALQEGAAGSGRYSVTLRVPEQIAAGMYQIISVSWRCSIQAMQAASVDSAVIGSIQTNDATPGGTVRNAANNAPVSGATVTLYQVPGWRLRTNPGDNVADSCESIASRPAGQAWSQPAPLELGEWVLAEAVEGDAALITPAINPQTTGGNGGFGWQVKEGCYYVEVNAAGFAPAISPLIGVQSALVDLSILLGPNLRVFLPVIVR